jgi:hypothetical protein
MFDELRFMLLQDWNGLTDECYCENCVCPVEREEAEVLVIQAVEELMTEKTVYS